MKALLMVLLLANLAFFAWQEWYDPSRSQALPEGRPDAGLGKGLRLVGESEKRAEPVVTESTRDEAVSADVPIGDEDDTGSAAVTAPGSAAVGSAAEEGEGEDVLVEATEAPQTCATLGPFDQLEMAQVAEARLESLGSTALVRETGGQIRSGFWVYLPPFPSRGEAKRIEDALREKGVRDLFIVTGSEQRNAISLGLFSTPERADQRAAEIGRIGFTPRVAERFRDATVYWVDFREPAGVSLGPERIGVLGASEVLPEKRAIACEEIAGEAGEE